MRVFTVGWVVLMLRTTVALAFNEIVIVVVTVFVQVLLTVEFPNTIALQAPPARLALCEGRPPMPQAEAIAPQSITQQTNSLIQFIGMQTPLVRLHRTPMYGNRSP